MTQPDQKAYDQWPAASGDSRAEVPADRSPSHNCRASFQASSGDIIPGQSRVGETHRVQAVVGDSSGSLDSHYVNRVSARQNAVMAKRTRRMSPPTKPLVRVPTRIGTLDAAAVVGELRQIHEDAEDPDVERMPADDELFGALVYVEKHADALRKLSREVQCAAALKRVRLWEYLREQTDRHQVRAVAAARDAGAEWVNLAPMLAVRTPNAAYNKAKRLQAANLMDATPVPQPVRRTPEAVLKAERRLIMEEAAERRAQEAAQRRHTLLVPLAVQLLEQRDGLVENEDTEYWLEEVEAVLPHCRTPLQMVSLSRYLEATVRALDKVQATTARPAAFTDEACRALAAVAQFLQGAEASSTKQ